MVDVEDADRKSILEMYAGIRVSDVCDALDALGLLDQGSMGPQIRPVWLDRERLSHRICGFAVTVRYLPTKRRYAPQTVDEAAAVREEWNRSVWPEGDMPVASGDVLVIDGAGIRNIGYIGSNNVMRWRSKGAVGVVTNAGCRDSDEIAMEGIPVYSAYIGHGRKPGRVEFDSYNRPVCVGGVMVCPGDFVVADGDGVIVVPKAHIAEVARLAARERDSDMKARRKLYEKLGLPEDATLH